MYSMPKRFNFVHSVFTHADKHRLIDGNNGPLTFEMILQNISSV